jgi:choline monooxygenase
MPASLSTIKRHQRNIAQARTLHKDFYLSDIWFERSKEKLFAPSWQFIGDIGITQGENNLIPFTLLKGFLDEPLLLSCRAGRPVKCLSNVCTHRGNILIESPCRAEMIRCRYHGRVFDCDGQFRSMPEFQKVKNFPSRKDSLPAVALHQWMNLLFVSVTGRWKASEVFAPLNKYLGFLDNKTLKYQPQWSRDYELDAHWALYCENYLEGFHIPYIHQSLNKMIDYDSYTTRLFRFVILQTALSRSQTPAFQLPANHPDTDKKVAAYYFFLFPNLMLNFYPWGLSVNIVKPLSLQKTIISYLTYTFKDAETQSVLMLDQIEKEDQEAILRVQRGIHSRLYSHGRYSVTREQGVHHFHQLIARHI